MDLIPDFLNLPKDYQEFISALRNSSNELREPIPIQQWNEEFSGLPPKYRQALGMCLGFAGEHEVQIPAAEFRIYAPRLRRLYLAEELRRSLLRCSASDPTDFNTIKQINAMLAWTGYKGIGASRGFLRHLHDIYFAALMRTTVLVLGPRGTGKELVAETLHSIWTRDEARKGKLIRISCDMKNESALESQLFGHERGSFTGADKRYIGAFEQAQHGTLFLDELASAGSAVQDKLLRVLQEFKIRRMGGTEEISIDARVIAATNDMDRISNPTQFRVDLLDRLTTNVIHTLPLTNYEREEDVIVLTFDRLKKINGQSESSYELDDSAVQAIFEADLSGNTRSLDKILMAGIRRAYEEKRTTLSFRDIPRKSGIKHRSAPCLDFLKGDSYADKIRNLMLFYNKDTDVKLSILQLNEAGASSRTIAAKLKCGDDKVNRVLDDLGRPVLVNQGGARMPEVQMHIPKNKPLSYSNT